MRANDSLSAELPGDSQESSVDMVVKFLSVN